MARIAPEDCPGTPRELMAARQFPYGLTSIREAFREALGRDLKKGSLRTLTMNFRSQELTIDDMGRDFHPCMAKKYAEYFAM